MNRAGGGRHQKAPADTAKNDEIQILGRQPGRGQRFFRRFNGQVNRPFTPVGHMALAQFCHGKQVGEIGLNLSEFTNAEIGAIGYT